MNEKIINGVDYLIMLSKYKIDKEELELKRKNFYEDNPDFPIKEMYMQVTSPPQKIIIKIV